MSVAFTPGPWMAASRASSIVGLPVVGPQGAAICNVHARDEVQSNARLIASAPDLYGALRCFLEDERFQVGVGGNPIVVERMLSDARAALAKARGETTATT